MKDMKKPDPKINLKRMTEQAAAGPWTNGTPTKEDKYLVRWSDGSWGGAYWFGGEWMWDGKLSTSLDPIAFAEINLPEGEIR